MRLRVLVAAIAVSVGCLASGCTTGGHVTSIRTAAIPAAAQVASVRPTGNQVQVIAHPDDDLYFMAPDVAKFIAAGLGSTTVVLTAGENNGSGALDREQYAGTRQEGLRAAYARMAGVDNVWRRAAITVADKRIELDTLVARPQVALAFLNLPDGKDTLPLHLGALENLWLGVYSAVPTLVPVGSAVPDIQLYTAADLTNVLIGLFNRGAVTVARTMDSHPDHRFPADHTDHIHAALFAEAALASVGTPVTSYAYRGYGITGLPANLDPVNANAKKVALAGYGEYDPDAGLEGAGVARIQRIYPRYLGATLRSFRQADGQLSFLGVVSGLMRVWPADTKAKPQIVGGPPIAPPFTVVRQPDGQPRIFALRLGDFHLVTTARAGNGLFTPWVDLGNPDFWNPGEIGSPEAVVDPRGQLFVFVKNRSGGISMRTMPPGGNWATWQDLGGTGVIETVSATVSADGRVELYAPTTAGIRVWESPRVGGGPELQPKVIGSVAAGPLSVVTGPGGPPQIFYRNAGDTTVRATQRNTDHSWTPPVDLESVAGLGPVVAVVSDAMTVLVAATPAGQLRTTTVGATAASLSVATWASVPGIAGQQPAAGIDGTGRVVVAVLGPDGALVVHTR